jgi:hypothetical protein
MVHQTSAVENIRSRNALEQGTVRQFCGLFHWGRRGIEPE